MGAQGLVADVKSWVSRADGQVGSVSRPQCLYPERMSESLIAQADENENRAAEEEDLTQAGYKRLRASVACDPCRKRKAKCDASRPNCSTCLRLKSRCSYDGVSMNAEQLSECASPDRRAHERTGPDEGGQDALYSRQDIFASSSPGSALLSEPSAASTLLPYIDAFLQNVHPVGCNNFLHPGVLGEALGKAPRVLVLALCGITAKFTNVNRAQKQGQLWVDEAMRLVIRGLDSISTLDVTVLQFLATHEMQEGRFMAAWNLIGETADH